MAALEAIEAAGGRHYWDIFRMPLAGAEVIGRIPGRLLRHPLRESMVRWRISDQKNTDWVDVAIAGAGLVTFLKSVV